MKKQILKSALIAMAGVGLLGSGAMAGQLPTTDWPASAGLVEFLNLTYFPGAELSVPALDFSGPWIYTAIGFESGNINNVDQTLYGVGQGGTAADANLTFTTLTRGDWGTWETINFNTTNLYFEDSNGPFDVPLDPFTATADPGFKIYQLVQDSLTLSYLANPLKLKAGDYIIGFNDNSRADTDSDYDDIIIVARPVPEPATMLLFGTGLAGLAAIGRRRKTQA